MRRGLHEGYFIVSEDINAVHDNVYQHIQGTIDMYFAQVEADPSGETRKEFLEQIMFLMKDWDDYCAKYGVVGQPLSVESPADRGIPYTRPAATQPKPEPVRNFRREAILAQRARGAT